MAEINLANQKTFTVGSKDLEPILKYLGSRPLAEVHKIFNDFVSSLKEVPESPEQLRPEGQ